MNYVYRRLRPHLMFLIVACFVLVGNGNAADGNPHSKTAAQAARLGREFDLKAGHQVTLKGESLRIRFAEVKEDSRCPTDVKCVWAGNAAVRLEASFRGRASKSLTLNTTVNSQPVDYRGYKITLLRLNPSPRSTHKIAAGDYIATLLVTKT